MRSSGPRVWARLDAHSPFWNQYTATAAGSRSEAGDWDGLRESTSAAGGPKTSHIPMGPSAKVRTTQSASSHEPAPAAHAGYRFWNRRSPGAQRRRVRWNDHGQRWRQHQVGRARSEGTNPQDSRETSGDHPGSTRERRAKRPVLGDAWTRRSVASLRAFPLPSTVHGRDRGCP